MAQRTGAERFLASIAKSASAGVILALALAALALAGCGGDSSDGEAGGASSSTSTATTASAAGGSQGGARGSAGNEGGAQGSDTSRGGGSAKGAAPADGQGNGNKQGPRVARPKGPQEPASTPQEIANATVADMTLASPAVIPTNGEPGSLPPTYTCDGKNSWPALSWGGVPPGTAELALYVMNVQPVDEKLFVDWAVSGIDPGLAGIDAGELPKGVTVGTNGFGKRGYSLCPEGRGEIYMFALYALPKRLGLRPGFDAREARAQILDVSGNVGLMPALYAHS